MSNKTKELAEKLMLLKREYFESKSSLTSNDCFKIVEICDEFYREEIEKLKSELRRERAYVDLFITLSNGVSAFARANWMSVNAVKKKIMRLYEFQCEMEKAQKERV